MQQQQTSFDRSLTVHVADSALLHLMLAGMESHKVRHWGATVTANRGPAETAGLLFGHATTKGDMDHVMVEHVSTDTFAKGTYWSVDLNRDVTQAKCEVIEERWPYMSLVGDFHTHPYKTCTDATGARGWKASADDRQWWSGEHQRAMCRPYVALILTIARLTRRPNGGRFTPKTIGSNTIHWHQLDRYRFWLTAYAIDHDGDRLTVSPESATEHPTRPHVYIDVPTVNGTNAWFSY